MPIAIPYDVTDPGLRTKLITDILPQSITSLEKTTKPKWGQMSAQHMVEHLIFTFQMSTDKLMVNCNTQEEKLGKMQAFLGMNRPMPKGYINPVSGEKLVELQYKNMDQAKQALDEEVRYYLSYYDENPEATQINATFGELNAEGWQKFHFKHCFHHLSQFGLIKEE